MDNIDWSLAQRVGEMVAGTPALPGSSLRLPATPVSEIAETICSYTEIELQRQPPPLELVDRPRWIQANLRSMRPLLEPLSERMGGDGLGPLAGAARSASGLLLGAQVGALTGMLSQRVLGQYDVALLDASVQPRLLLVAPNLAQAARNLLLDRDQLIAWVTIHEVTHAVQFGGAPWLREHLAGTVSELMESMELRPSAPGGPNLRDLLGLRRGAGDIGELIARARRGELLRITLGEDRWQLLERMQAAMTLIEGHAEHVMDAVGAQALPSLPRLRAAMTRRRRSRPLAWRVLERLLGMEMKMRQYEIGRRFCDTVVREGGPGALAPAWHSPEGLPSAAELEAPLLWMARTG